MGSSSLAKPRRTHSLSQAGRLLQGSRLDGSLLSHHHNDDDNNNNDESRPPAVSGTSRGTTTTTTPTTSTTTTATVGGVVPGSGCRKLIYAARTHSQLSQFVRELDQLRPYYPNLTVVALGGRSHLCGHDELQSKGSRSRSNEAVLNETCLDWQKQQPQTAKNKTRNTNGPDDNDDDDDDERMTVPVVSPKLKQRPKKRWNEATTTGAAATPTKNTTHGCPLLSNRAAVDTLALHLLTEPTDIEEAAFLGRSVQACAYYASRTAVAAAQVVVVPYSLLFLSSSKSSSLSSSKSSMSLSLPLSLSQSLVVLDEAHNVPEATCRLHSCTLTLSVLRMALDQLQWYVEKYGPARLASRHLYCLGQLRQILLALQKAMSSSSWSSKQSSSNNSSSTRRGNNVTSRPPQQQQPQSSSSPAAPKMMTGMQLLTALRLENTNVSHVLRYLQDSGLPQKLLGYNAYLRKQQPPHEPEQPPPSSSSTSMPPRPPPTEQLSKHVSAMSVVQTMLEKFVLTNGEGKFLLQPSRTTRSTGMEQQVDEEEDEEVEEGVLQFVLLKPAIYLHPLLQEAYAVAFVGGTLQPFLHVAAELLSPPGDDNNNNDIAATMRAQQCMAMAAQADAAQQQPQRRQVHRPRPQETTTTRTPTTTSPSSQPTITITDTSYSLLSPSFAAFSCNHVVSPSHVLLQRWGTGPTGRTLDFRHLHRYDHDMVHELGLALIHGICPVIPPTGGIVVFVASYAYESFLVQQWQRTGLWDQLQQERIVFREKATTKPNRSSSSKSSSSSSSPKMESILESYAQAVKRSNSSSSSTTTNHNNNNTTTTTTTKKNPRGALLFSVIGGKLSEGINFLDDLARCVVVVGLPYPDRQDPVLHEKMATMDQVRQQQQQQQQQQQNNTTLTAAAGGVSGSSYYHNLCMRAVNQSIGRAIRHANDYATILLLDQRYETDARVWSGLPQWLKQGQQLQQQQGHQFHRPSFAERMEQIRAFFQAKQPKNNKKENSSRNAVATTPA